MVGVVTAEDYVDLEVPTSEFHGEQDPVTQMMAQEVSFYSDRHGLGAETPRCKHLHIWTLAVRPEAAGRRVSKQLVTHVLARARELGFEWAFAETSGERALHVFTDHLGFKEVSRVDWSKLPDCAFASMADHGQAVVELDILACTL